MITASLPALPWPIGVQSGPSSGVIALLAVRRPKPFCRRAGRVRSPLDLFFAWPRAGFYQPHRRVTRSFDLYGALRIDWQWEGKALIKCPGCGTFILTTADLPLLHDALVKSRADLLLLETRLSNLSFGMQVVRTDLEGAAQQLTTLLQRLEGRQA